MVWSSTKFKTHSLIGLYCFAESREKCNAFFDFPCGHALKLNMQEMGCGKMFCFFAHFCEKAVTQTRPKGRDAKGSGSVGTGRFRFRFHLQ